jgi:sensor histidine kinase YesM
LAWKAIALASLWIPPSVGVLKGNFDVAIHENFAVVAAVISNFSSDIILAATQRLSSIDVLMGEAYAALLSSRLAASASAAHFLLEGDALLVTLAVSQPITFSSWHFSSYVSDIRLVLSSFQSWHASKISKCANYCVHVLAKWAATHLMFGSTPIGFSILSIRIKNGKDSPL